MMGRITILACLLVGVLTAGCDISIIIPDPNDMAPEDLFALMDEATDIVRDEFPDARLVEVFGFPDQGAGLAYEAEDLVDWEFWFVDDIDDATPGQVVLPYENGVFGNLLISDEPITGTVYDRLPEDVTYQEAIDILRDDGITSGFENINLRKLLQIPEPDEAYYIFAFPDDSFIAVGAESGDIIE